MKENEPYGIIELGFWTDREIKKPLGPLEKLVLSFLFSAPDSRMSGIFYCPPAAITDHTGVPIELVVFMLDGASHGASYPPSDGAWQLMSRVPGSLRRWVTWDQETDEIFVHNLARKRVKKLGEAGRRGTKGDTRRATLEKQLRLVQSQRLVGMFLQHYADWGLNVSVSPDVVSRPAPEVGATQPGAAGGSHGASNGASDTPSPNQLSSKQEAVSSLPSQERRREQRVGGAHAAMDRLRNNLPPEYHPDLDALLCRVEEPVAWCGELTMAVEGGTAGPGVTYADLGMALRDYRLNGKAKEPNIEYLRTYVKRAADKRHRPARDAPNASRQASRKETPSPRIRTIV